MEHCGWVWDSKSGGISTGRGTFAEGGYYMGSSNEMSYGNGYGNLEGYPLGEYSFGLETIIKVCASVGRSDGKVISSVGDQMGILVLM